MKNITSFFIFLLSISVVASSSYAANTENNRQVTVTGQCNHMVSPDRGSITLTVEFQDMDVTKATKQTKQSYTRVSSAVKKLALNDFNMRTAEYSVNEITAWENKQQVNKGFRARMGLWISTSDIDRIGEIIAIAAKEKVKDVNALQTYLSDDKQLKEEIACLEDAAKNARLKAIKLASALNASLGSVLLINETEKNLSSWPQPRMQKMFGVQAMDMAESAPQVEAGQQNLSLNVQVTFALK